MKNDKKEAEFRELFSRVFSDSGPLTLLEEFLDPQTLDAFSRTSRSARQAVITYENSEKYWGVKLNALGPDRSALLKSGETFSEAYKRHAAYLDSISKEVSAWEDSVISDVTQGKHSFYNDWKRADRMLAASSCYHPNKVAHLALPLIISTEAIRQAMRKYLSNDYGKYDAPHPCPVFFVFLENYPHSAERALQILFSDEKSLMGMLKGAVHEDHFFNACDRNHQIKEIVQHQILKKITYINTFMNWLFPTLGDAIPLLINPVFDHEEKKRALLQIWTHLPDEVVSDKPRLITTAQNFLTLFDYEFEDTPSDCRDEDARALIVQLFIDQDILPGGPIAPEVGFATVLPQGTAGVARARGISEDWARAREIQEAAAAVPAREEKTPDPGQTQNRGLHS